MPIVFITGASSGFGKATAEKFAQAGYQLILNARRLDRLEALKTHLVATYGSQVLLLPFDVRNREEVAQQLDNMPAAWQKIDVLVNNAGLAAGRDAFQDGSMDDWELMIDTNLKGFDVCEQMGG
jgi:3-hydroxy acid dehydrogenase/malonic semialdehyde reductase